MLNSEMLRLRFLSDVDALQIKRKKFSEFALQITLFRLKASLKKMKKSETDKSDHSLTNLI